MQGSVDCGGMVCFQLCSSFSIDVVGLVRFKVQKCRFGVLFLISCWYSLVIIFVLNVCIDLVLLLQVCILWLIQCGIFVLYCLEKWCSWLKLVIGMMLGVIGICMLSWCMVLIKWKYVFGLQKYWVIVVLVLVLILVLKCLRLVSVLEVCGWVFGQVFILMWNVLLCLVWMNLISLVVQCMLLGKFILEGRLLCSVIR